MTAGAQVNRRDAGERPTESICFDNWSDGKGTRGIRCASRGECFPEQVRCGIISINCHMSGIHSDKVRNSSRHKIWWFLIETSRWGRCCLRGFKFALLMVMPSYFIHFQENLLRYYNGRSYAINRSISSAQGKINVVSKCVWKEMKGRERKGQERKRKGRRKIEEKKRRRDDGRKRKERGR